MKPNDLPASTGWEAELKLGFVRRSEATVLVERRHRGPLRVQKALYPEGEGVCQALLLHPPSGLVGGDHLQIGVQVGEGAHAQLTTPGAGKWYRSAGAEAAQILDFSVATGGTLEWLPQETIVFDGALARMHSHVAISGDARFLGWEILCLGRSAAGERFTQGHLALATRIERDGRPLWVERGQLDGDDPLLASPVGFAGATVSATLLATLPVGFAAAPLLEACRAIAPADGAHCGLTALSGLLVARYLGDASEAARHWLTQLWRLLRPALLGREAIIPRIWNT